MLALKCYAVKPTYNQYSSRIVWGASSRFQIENFVSEQQGLDRLYEGVQSNYSAKVPCVGRSF